MNELRIKKTITGALQLKDPRITNIQRTPGGLTNESYFATVNNEEYVVRFSGSGTDKLINRAEEKANLLYGTKLGINPPMLFFNIDSGLKITRKIEGALPITPTSARKRRTMMQIIHLFKHLHRTETPMNNRFKLFELLSHYESLVKDVSDVAIEKLKGLKKDVVALQKTYESFHITETACHIDPDYSNLIKSKHDEIYLIDWEYSGMFDPLWDIATIFLSLDFHEEEQHFFLKQYLERKPVEEELQRIAMHVIFQDYLWYLWGVFKAAQGDDTADGALRRSERAKENVALYKKAFEADIVV